MNRTVLKPLDLDVSNTNAKKVIIAALITSQVAALIMAVVMMVVFTIFLGKGPLYPVQVIGSTFFGEEALQGFNVGAFIVGLLLHLAVAFVWGIPFAILVYIWRVHSVAISILIGLLVAIVSMVLDTYVFVPAVMNALYGVDIWNREVPLGWSWAAHLVFGASFGLFPKVYNTLNQPER